MLVDASMTGVLRIPTLPTMFWLPEKVKLAIGAGVAPTRLAKLTDHNWVPLSASNA